jgi:lambda family phage portal protein
MFNWLRRGKPAKRRSVLKHIRSFAAASMGRLFGAWTTTNTTLDYDLRYELRTVRARSRDLAINDEFYTKFLGLVCDNIIGNSGIKMQARIVEPRRVDGVFVDVPDELANKRVEDAWKKWGKTCDVTGKLSWIDAQKLFIETVARDGECLIRKVRSTKYKFGFALQFLEVDLLDEDYNETFKNGNTIKMGVELDSVGKPVAYHLLQDLVGIDGYYNHGRSRAYIRIPADDIIHSFKVERAIQTRGYPWGVSGFTTIKNIKGYTDASITNARVGASKMGFYETPDGQYTGDSKDSAGNPISEVEPGVFEVLPPGVKFTNFNPDYPTGEYDPFMKRNIMQLASSWRVPYVSLASDLEGVSYSSIRQGELEARDRWRVDQQWTIDNLLQDVFEEWLMSALLTQDLMLPSGKFDKFSRVIFVPRGWAWVDPSKDVKAKVAEIDAGLKSPQQVVAEMGGDYRDVQVEIAAAKKLRKELGTETEADKAAEPDSEDDDNGTET